MPKFILVLLLSALMLTNALAEEKTATPSVTGQPNCGQKIENALREYDAYEDQDAMTLSSEEQVCMQQRMEHMRMQMHKMGQQMNHMQHMMNDMPDPDNHDHMNH